MKGSHRSPWSSCNDESRYPITQRIDSCTANRGNIRRAYCENAAGGAQKAEIVKGDHACLRQMDGIAVKGMDARTLRADAAL